MRGLSDTTIKAYSIDLRQFTKFFKENNWQSKIQVENIYKIFI